MMLLALMLCAADLPNGNALLSRIDSNTGSENKVIVAEIRIAGRRGSRTVRVRSWVSGVDRSFTEYLAPERDKGTKMLKLGNDLWTYTPATDRVLRISGHMLRQSVSGSDLSYEDMMEDPKLANLYTAVTSGADSLAGRPVWKLDLTAKKPDVSYQSRRLWVDSERFIVLREERFSKSGKLLKTSEALEVKQLGGRWVATKARFRDALKTGGGTEFVIEDIKFDVAIPPGLFSKASLRR
mgnify:CR=1 FL=1|uniref:Outer membrane lipoprotein-sorting protein n=1 Tax=candidate division WOR-3 bacterium TaxID=2052148 RepID=A0A7C4CAL8_UNCW3